MPTGKRGLPAMQLQKLLTFSGLTVELFEDASDSSAPSQPVVEDEPAMHQPSRWPVKHRLARIGAAFLRKIGAAHFRNLAVTTQFPVGRVFAACV